MVSSNQSADSQPMQDYGQHWKEQERVRRYVEQTDRDQAERSRLFALIGDLLPFEPDEPLQILDIGSGHGPLAAALLDAFPKASAVGLDLSEAMMDEGRERMARFGDRFRYHLGDFADGALPPDLPGPFHVVVSASALHHLPADRKRLLYRVVFDRLVSGGCFFNLDSMAPQDEYLQERYHQARDRASAREGREEAPGNHGPMFAHYFEPVEEHVSWLSDAGFAHVHCFWKELGRALVGGYRL